MVKDGRKIAIGAGLAAGVVGVILLLKKKAPVPPPPPPELANIYGIVVFRGTGAPLLGVKISMDGIITYTNASGEYLISNQSPGSYTMTLEKEGYETLWDTVSIVEGNNEINAEMTLVPAIMSSLHGYITDIVTGAAIAGAEIIIVEKTGFMEANVYETTSGASGFYSLENMAFENDPIVVDISILADGYSMIKLVNVGLDEGANVKNFEMTVPPPKFGSFRGKVVDYPTGDPLQGVLVSMDGLTDQTDSAGQYEFTNITAKQYTVTLSREGYEPVEFNYNLTEGENEYPTIKMRRTEAYVARLYGYITDNETGEPVFGADITVYQDYDSETADYHVFTNEQGYYEITDMIPEVSASMVVEAGGYKDYIRAGVRIHEGDNERNISLEWLGGSRTVPRFTSYSLPDQIVSGEEFPVAMTVWLPYKHNRLFEVYLIIETKGSSPAGDCRNIVITWRFLPASTYDQGDPEWLREKGYIRFDQEGQYLLETMAMAIQECEKSEMPVRPGIYEVRARVERDVAVIDESGELEIRNGDNPEHYWWQGKVGTIEIMHPPGFGGLYGVITGYDAYALAAVKKLQISIDEKWSQVWDWSHLLTGELQYESISLPIGDYIMTMKFDLTDFHFTETFEFSIKQGWNEKNIIFPTVVSPTGHFDPENAWDGPEYAYDGSLSRTWAKALERYEWSSPLELIFDPPVMSGAARFASSGYEREIDLDIHRDGAWVNVYQGTFKPNTWEKKTFAPGSIDKVRIRLRQMYSNKTRCYFQEFQLFAVE